MSTVKESANLCARMIYQTARQYFGGIAHIIMGGFDKYGFHVYDLYPDGSINEIKEYISSGSGSIIVFGVLESTYKDSITVKEAEDLALKCISASMQRDAGSGNGVDVMTITKDGIKKTVQKKVSGILV